jgi:type IV pilus assembly protein PilC
MAQYTFRIATTSGAVQTLEVDGENPEAARRILEAQGYLVFDGGLSSRTEWRFPRLVPARIGARVLLIFNQELLALVRAGLPILAALDLLRERSQHPLLRQLLADARETVRGGAALSAALAKFPRIFSPLFTAALQAGEQSGNFTDALARYVEYQRRLLALRQRLRAALTYPVILTLASFAVIVFLLAFVVPTFTRIYEDMEGQLPVATRMLVHVTGHLRAALPLALGLLALAAVSIWRWRRTPAGEEITDRWLLHFPWLGSLLAGYQFSRFARTLAMMQAGGIPMIPSLEATLSVVRNRHLASRIRTALPRVTAGSSLADSLGRTGVVPPLMLELIAVGENSGALTEMLGHTADLLDAELDTRLTTLTAAIEPVIMIGMGMVVATIVVIMYLPIFHLASVVR